MERDDQGRQAHENADGNMAGMIGATALGAFFAERAIELSQYGMAVEGESVVALGVLALGFLAVAGREVIRFFRGRGSGES
jgi:hypothetical protein